METNTSSSQIKPRESARAFGRPAHILLMLLAFALSGLWVSCGDSGSTSGSADQSETTGEKAADDGKITFTPERIAELKAKFEVDSASGWHTHSHWGKSLARRATLSVEVNPTGYYVLSSNFVSGKAIDHTHIVVTIGDSTYTSNTVDLKSPEHSATTSEGKVYEVNRYTKYGDNKIFQKIAESGDAVVKVRFVAKDAHSDIELTPEDKAAIEDCYYASLLARAGQL
jgi:hypothetical protein